MYVLENLIRKSGAKISFSLCRELSQETISGSVKVRQPYSVTSSVKQDEVSLLTATETATCTDHKSCQLVEIISKLIKDNPPLPVSESGLLEIFSNFSSVGR